MPTPRYVVQDAQWAVERIKRGLQKHLLLPRMSIASQIPARHGTVRVQKDVAMPMHDGVRLYGDVYRPQAGGKLPAILTRMPYGKEEHYCYVPAIGRFWARQGYAFVAQDVRGKWRSEGRWEPFVNEADDGYNTLSWIASQPWCDGNIGMVGESYYGYTTWAAAATGHPNLKCISPSTTAMDIFGTWIYNQGAFCMQTMGIWAIEMNSRQYNNPFRLETRHLPLVTMDDEAGFPCEYYKDWLAHPTRDAYWDPIRLDDKYAQIEIPVLHFGGWYDPFLKATIEDWSGVREQSADTRVRENQWLVIGPWDHSYSTDTSHRVGQLDIGTASATTYWDQCLAFFDFWLRGAENGFDQDPRVRLFTTGENVWRTGGEWPPAGTVYQDFYLHSDGKAHLPASDGVLSETVPVANELADQYTYDPLDPVSLTREVDLWERAAFLQDRASLPARADVLVYDTTPLKEDLEITGPVTVTLFASSSAVDTDFTAALVDVFPQGYAHLVQEGIVRASYREQDREPAPIETGRVYEYTIDLFATSHVVQAGHRVRVEISSSNFDRYDRNPNTGEPMGRAAAPVPARQQVFHSAAHPSRITLPIIPGGSQGGSHAQ